MPLRSNRCVTRMPTSSAVRSRNVASRQLSASRSPSKTPRTMFVLPTSMASSMVLRTASTRFSQSRLDQVGGSRDFTRMVGHSPDWQLRLKRTVTVQLHRSSPEMTRSMRPATLRAARRRRQCPPRCPTSRPPGCPIAPGRPAPTARARATARAPGPPLPPRAARTARPARRAFRRAPRRPSGGRPSSVSIDVARSASSGGYAADRRLIPNPRMTYCRPSAPVDPSARTPASLRRRAGTPLSTTTSFGHLICTGNPDADTDGVGDGHASRQRQQRRGGRVAAHDRGIESRAGRREPRAPESAAPRRLRRRDDGRPFGGAALGERRRHVVGRTRFRKIVDRVPEPSAARRAGRERCREIGGQRLRHPPSLTLRWTSLVWSAASADKSAFADAPGTSLLAAASADARFADVRGRVQLELEAQIRRGG